MVIPTRIAGIGGILNVGLQNKSDSSNEMLTDFLVYCPYFIRKYKLLQVRVSITFSLLLNLKSACLYPLVSNRQSHLICNLLKEHDACKLYAVLFMEK
jgi:hypothetical protein